MTPSPRMEVYYRRWLRRSYYRAMWIRGRCVHSRKRFFGPSEHKAMVITPRYEEYHIRTIEMMVEEMDKPFWNIRDFQHLIAIQHRFQSTIRVLTYLGELK